MATTICIYPSSLGNVNGAKAQIYINLSLHRINKIKFPLAILLKLAEAYTVRHKINSMVTTFCCFL